MTRAIAALILLTTVTACNPPEPSEHTADVLPAVTDRQPYTTAPPDPKLSEVRRSAPVVALHSYVVALDTAAGVEYAAAVHAEQAREAQEAREAVPATTTPAVRHTPTGGACGGWRDLIASYFPASQVGKACAVMLCESQGNPNAVSHTNDHGLFQINVVHSGSFDWANRYDPATNTAFAASLWRQQGWSPWVCA